MISARLRAVDSEATLIDQASPVTIGIGAANSHSRIARLASSFFVTALARHLSDENIFRASCVPGELPEEPQKPASSLRCTQTANGSAERVIELPTVQQVPRRWLLTLPLREGCFYPNEGTATC
jgi:hypothetical protein